MTAETAISPAELADRILRLVAYSMFAVALVFCLSIAEFFAGESVAAMLDIVVKVLGVGILALMAVVFFWKIQPVNSRQHRQQLAEDGFLQVSFEKAMARSWMLSFLLLVILQALDNLVLATLPEMPLEITIQCVLALMLLLFSMAFLFYTRSGYSND